MSYRNKSYVIFDGDTDIWAYAYMKGWKANRRIDFDFFDAHSLRPLTASASEETVKRRLRERMASASQVVALVGEKRRICSGSSGGRLSWRSPRIFRSSL